MMHVIKTLFDTDIYSIRCARSTGNFKSQQSAIKVFFVTTFLIFSRFHDSTETKLSGVKRHSVMLLTSTAKLHAADKKWKTEYARH